MSPYVIYLMHHLFDTLCISFRIVNSVISAVEMFPGTVLCIFGPTLWTDTPLHWFNNPLVRFIKLIQNE